MAKSKWNSEFIITAYELARDGHKMTTIAHALGVSVMTFNKWRKNKKLLRIALKRGFDFGKDRDKKVPTLKRYIYERLPKALQNTWNKIDKMENAVTGAEKVQAILAHRGRRARQHLFLYAWTQSNFSLSQALSKVCISRSAFEKWKTDPDFLELVQEIEWHKKNFFEDALVRLVDRGEASAVVFANKTLNADRFPDKKTVNVNVTGNIDVNYIKVDELDLPIGVRKMILKEYRQRKMVESTVVNQLPAAQQEHVAS